MLFGPLISTSRTSNSMQNTNIECLQIMKVAANFNDIDKREAKCPQFYFSIVEIYGCLLLESFLPYACLSDRKRLSFLR